MGTTATAVLLVLTGSAAVLTLAGCARHGIRELVCHGSAAAAMAAMLLPDADPLGHAAWVTLLAGTATWTTVAVARARFASVDVTREAAGAREVAETWLMCMLVLLMPEHGGPVTSDPAGHYAHAGAIGLLPGAALAGLVAVWSVALTASHRSGGAAASTARRAEADVGRPSRAWRRDAAAAGSVLAVASMLAMTGLASLG